MVNAPKLEIAMGKRTNSNQRIRLVILLLGLFLAGAGCGDSRQAENAKHASQGGETEHPPKTGALHDSYFYEGDGIVISSGERFMYSDWGPVEFDYICMDPTCSHLSAGCSARAVSNEGEMLNDFSLLYEDRLIILHAYREVDAETWSNEDSGTEITEYHDVYYTEVYEADPDGSNRRKKTTFPGAISNTIISYTAVLVDGKLYFGGPTEDWSRWEYENYGENMTSSFGFSDAIYCLDLNDYTLETFAVTKEKEGMGDMYQLYEYDGMIYAIESSFQEDRAVWYRIDPAAGGCEEILRFDSDVARFCGAIGDTVYYYYDANSSEKLYARDIAAGAEEQEIMRVAGENMDVMAFILDGQILFRTERSLEEGSRMTEYAVLDRDGNLLDTIRYNDYIVFLDVVGDKLIYFRMGSDWEHWWADKADLEDLVEKGTQVGPFTGNRLDTLGD